MLRQGQRHPKGRRKDHVIRRRQFNLQLQENVEKIVVKYLQSFMEYGYKQIVYQTITLIQEAAVGEVQ